MMSAWGDGDENQQASAKETEKAAAEAQRSAAEALQTARNDMLQAQSSVAAMQNEMGALSGKVSEVVVSVTNLESEVRTNLQGLQDGLSARGEGSVVLQPGQAGDQQQVEATLGRVREQLEGRVALLEQKIDCQEPGELKGEDLSALTDTLQQVEADLRSLDAVATQDMRPKLEQQATEMQKLWQQLNDLWQRMQNQPPQGGGGGLNSMLTTKGGPRCLVCYDPNTQPASKKIMIGKDGKTYFQGLDQQKPLGPTCTPFGQQYAPPAESGGMISALMKPRMGQGMAGTGPPNRKYMHVPPGCRGGDDDLSPHGRPHSRSASSLRSGSPAGIARGGGSASRPAGPRLARMQNGPSTPSVAGFYF